MKKRPFTFKLEMTIEEPGDLSDLSYNLSELAEHLSHSSELPKKLIRVGFITDDNVKGSWHIYRDKG